MQNCGLPVHYLQWNKVLEGNFVLPSPCILAGWSLGGQLAMGLTANPAVKGVLLVSSMSCIASSGERPGVDPSLHSEIESMLAKNRVGYLKSFFRECGARGDGLSALIEQSFVFSNKELMLGLNTMFNRVIQPDRPVPATLIHGTDDRIIPFSCSRYLHDELFHSNAELIPVSGGSHLIPMTHPEVIAKGVRDLAECAGS